MKNLDLTCFVNRQIEVIPVEKIENEKIMSDIKIIKGKYNSLKELQDLISSMQSLYFKYFIKENLLFLKSTEEVKIAYIIHDWSK